MRPAIPNSSSVDSAFRSLAKRLESVRKKINAEAAGQMKADKYEAAKEWMEIGRSVADFTERVDAFTQEWKRLVKATRIAAGANTKANLNKLARSEKSNRTPPSKFCVPLLKALAARGGTANLEELIADLERSHELSLSESDRMVHSSSGAQRWHATVKRACRMGKREGWLEKHRDGIWEITAKGRAIASEKG